MWMKLCAAYDLFCALLHVAFLWTWRQTASWPLVPGGFRPVLDIFSIQITIVFLLVAYAYYFHAAALRTTALGRVSTAGWLVFWIVRLADDLLRGFHPTYLAFFVVGVALHSAAVVRRERTTASVAA